MSGTDEERGIAIGELVGPYGDFEEFTARCRPDEWEQFLELMEGVDCGDGTALYRTGEFDANGRAIWTKDVIGRA
jgi:hypothetical protein